MTPLQRVEYWIKSAKRDQKTANALFANGDYHWCLFFWHLVLEKILKAIIVKCGSEIPITHNLVRLIQQAKLPYDERDISSLKEITTFNLEARYDDYKLSFYKKATKVYAQRWIAACQKFASGWEKTL